MSFFYKQVSNLQYEMLLLTDSISKEGGCWELRLSCGKRLFLTSYIADFKCLCTTLSANKHIIVIGCFWRQKNGIKSVHAWEIWEIPVKDSTFVLFNPCSPHPLPNVCEYKDTCGGGKHHTHVSENSSKVDQASCSHQQEKQGRHVNIL